MCADYATIILIVPAEKVNRTGRKICWIDVGAPQCGTPEDDG